MSSCLHVLISSCPHVLKANSMYLLARVSLIRTDGVPRTERAVITVLRIRSTWVPHLRRNAKLRTTYEVQPGTFPHEVLPTAPSPPTRSPSTTDCDHGPSTTNIHDTTNVPTNHNTNRCHRAPILTRVPALVRHSITLPAFVSPSLPGSCHTCVLPKPLPPRVFSDLAGSDSFTKSVCTFFRTVPSPSVPPTTTHLSSSTWHALKSSPSVTPPDWAVRLQSVTGTVTPTHPHLAQLRLHTASCIPTCRPNPLHRSASSPCAFSCVKVPTAYYHYVLHTW